MYQCNLCDFEGKVPKNYRTGSDFSENNFPENFNAVYDFVVPDSYKLVDIKNQNVLFCFDMSAQSLANGSFHHILSSISSLLEYLEADVNVGFVLFDSLVTFFSIDDDDGEIMISRCADPLHPICTLGFDEMFLNVKTARDKIDKLIDYLTELGNVTYSTGHLELKSQCHNIETLGRTLLDVFGSRGGRAVIFASVHKVEPSATIKYPDNKKVTALAPKVDVFEKLGDQLAEKSVTIDMFITPQAEIELATTAPLSTNTGGHVYFFPAFDISVDSDRMYYDLYRNLTVTRGYDVACRLRTSSGIQTLNYHTPKGKVYTLDFRLPSLNSDQNIIADLQLGENLKDRSYVYLQFVTLYTNSYNTRLIRLVNLRLRVTNDMSSFYKTIDCHSFAYNLIRNEADKLLTKPPKTVNEDLMKNIVKLFRYYRNEVGGRYEAREFALPDKLKFFPLYLSAFLAKPCFNEKVHMSADHTFYTYLQLVQTNLNRLFFDLYAKVFDIGTMYKEWSEDAESLEPGAEVDGVIVLPSSLPANLAILRQDAVYLIDNGDCLYLYVRSYADPQLISALFGVDTFEEIDPTQQLPTIDDSEFNLRVQSIVARLREIKNGGGTQSLIVVKENSTLIARFRSAFSEDLGNYFAGSYWEFLSCLHERVKDD